MTRNIVVKGYALWSCKAWLESVCILDIDSNDKLAHINLEYLRIDTENYIWEFELLKLKGSSWVSIPPYKIMRFSWGLIEKTNTRISSILSGINIFSLHVSFLSQNYWGHLFPANDWHYAWKNPLSLITEIEVCVSFSTHTLF